MTTLTIIARLMDYPDEALWQHQEALRCAVEECPLSVRHKQLLHAFMDQLFAGSLLAAQAQYCALFDRGCALSLLLFEHVHGDSRARGQAMVDLLNQYQRAGLTLDSRELPDYLPLYLEYLASLDSHEARQGLVDIAPILALLATRLDERGSDYAALFTLLGELAGDTVDVDYEALRQKVRQESRDDTPEALDKVWEEEQVSFMSEANCGGNESHGLRHQQNERVHPQYVHVGMLTGEQK
ncbi:nitrate reductase molybdenum cofactor assembly chaperone [Mangrovibacter phragmitis]|uniref:nitrate reductase molybdenum cofactor assembly chaperone n=1 Tax=Mangrovibacter phragmitis TaxID=1691903 RepID=UPI00351581C3